MKKLLFLTGATLMMTACTNDEELFNGFEEPFSGVGTWKMTAMTVGTAVDLNGDGIASTDFMAETACYQNELIVLMPGATGSIISNSYADITVEGEFPTDATFTTECVTELEEIAITNYTIVEDTITITDEDGTTLSGTIQGNTMTFVIPDGQIYFDEEMNEVSSDDLTIVYTLQ